MLNENEKPHSFIVTTLIQKKSNALNDKNSDPKVYWTIVNNILHNIKVPSIPPTLTSGKVITNIVEKPNLFNFFSSQCTPWKILANFLHY